MEWMIDTFFDIESIVLLKRCSSFFLTMCNDLFDKKIKIPLSVNNWISCYGMKREAYHKSIKKVPGRAFTARVNLSYFFSSSEDYCIEKEFRSAEIDFPMGVCFWCERQEKK